MKTVCFVLLVGVWAPSALAGDFITGGAELPPADPVPTTYNAVREALYDLRAHTSGWVDVKSYGAVGNGIADDTAAIRSAIAAGSGKAVHFEDGKTYALYGVLSVPSGTILSGRAKLRAAAAVGSVLDLDEVSHVVISGLEIDAAAIAGFGVRINGGSHNRVMGSHVHDTVSEGIKIDGGTGHWVSGNSVVDCGRTGAEDHGIAAVAATSSLNQVRIQNNYVANAHKKGITAYAASPHFASDIVVLGNTIIGSGLGGIYLAATATGEALRNVTVAGNTLTDNYTGIEVDHAVGLSVTGNVIRGSRHFGMSFDGVIAAAVSANTVDLTSYYGVAFNNVTGPTRDIVFSGNVITNSNQSGAAYGPGLQLYNVTYAMVSNNIVADHSAAPKQSNGIVEGGTSDFNQFLDNIVTGVASGGSANLYYKVGAHSVLRYAQ